MDAGEWKPSSLGEVLVDANGKIIGEVYKAMGTGHNAISNGSPIGTYYTASQARRAVELSVVPNAIELTGSPLAASPATGGSDVE